MQSLKFGIERYDGRMNFGLWQIQVKDILIQYGLHKMLRGIPASDSSDGAEKFGTNDVDWKDLDLKERVPFSCVWLRTFLLMCKGRQRQRSFGRSLRRCIRRKESLIGCM
jgi:hypothetical protein